MTSSDLDVLLDMGFERARAELAIKKSGGLQGALEWLEKMQDTPLEEVIAGASKPGGTDNDNGDDEEEGGPALQEGEVPRSLVCNECGKKFRSQAQAEFHASKTEHTDFVESTEEIAPLTEEEKRARLEELRAKLAEKRATVSEQDKADQKRNEEIRRKATKESQDIKEDLAKKEQIKAAEKKKREKQDDLEAKNKIKARIAADKEERRLRAEREKAEREGRAPPPPPPTTAAAAPTTSGPVASKPASAYTETRLALQTPSGRVRKTFPVQTTLFEVAAALATEHGIQPTSFTQNFPKKTFSDVDFGSTLKELGLVPSAALKVD